MHIAEGKKWKLNYKGIKYFRNSPCENKVADKTEKDVEVSTIRDPHCGIHKAGRISRTNVKVSAIHIAECRKWKGNC